MTEDDYDEPFQLQIFKPYYLYLLKHIYLLPPLKPMYPHILTKFIQKPTLGHSCKSSNIKLLIDNAENCCSFL